MKFKASMVGKKFSIRSTKYDHCFLMFEHVYMDTFIDDNKALFVNVQGTIQMLNPINVSLLAEEK